MAKQKPVRIYGKILLIQAVKDKHSNFPGEKFQHKFTGKSAIYGLPNGDILIKGNKPLWKVFKYKR